MPPDCTLASEAVSGTKGNKIRLTYLLTANALGTEKRPLLVIGKSKVPRCFKKKSAKDLGLTYYHNTKAWMNAAIYGQYLSDWSRELIQQKCKIILLHDNFAGHKIPTEGLSQITVIPFAPNLTAHVHPVDAGVIRCFNAHYGCPS